MKPYRIVLADDHIMFREGIKSLIDATDGLAVVGEAADGAELQEVLRETPAEMVVIEISMPDFHPLEAIGKAKKLSPSLKVLILTMHNEKESLYRAMSAGADGYLLKEDTREDLMTAIRILRQERTYISPLMGEYVRDMFAKRVREGRFEVEVLSHRELEVLKLVADGKSSKEIADQLSISILTVQNHRANIKRKLNLRTNVDLVKYAIQKGYTEG